MFDHGRGTVTEVDGDIVDTIIVHDNEIGVSGFWDLAVSPGRMAQLDA